MNKLSRGVTALVAATLVLGASACSTNASSGNGESEEVTIRIGGTRGYINFLSAPYGDLEGTFKEHGVNVEVIYFDGAGLQLEALMAGEVDLINYNPAGLALSYMNGVTTPKAVGIVGEAPVGYALMAAADSEIAKVEDLEGGSIGSTSAGSTTDMYARYANDAYDLGAQVLPLGGSAMVASLTSGNVDAILAFPPMSYNLLQTGEGKTLIDFGDVPEVGYADLWLASADLVANEDNLRATLNGLYDAVELMIDDEEATIPFFIEEMSVSDEVARRAYEQIVPRLATDNTIDLQLMQNGLDLAAGLADGTVPQASDVVHMIDLERGE